MYHIPLQVKVWGNWACWTRPEMKVERVTYEVMTPSAAQGILQAIFWKPEFSWHIREIHVLRPIRHFSILRNEVQDRVIVDTTMKWATTGGGYYVDEKRTQRHTLALRDVAYTIVADIQINPGIVEDAAKYRDQFRRRVDRGQCYTMPYLGCREFSAFFGAPEADDHPQPITVDLGMMLFGIAYQSDQTGRGEPQFFHARLHDGILAVPTSLYY